MARWAMVAALAWPGAALAQDLVGDAASGETLFARQCVSCHVIADPAGEILAGRGAQVGPNLWGVVGRVPGSHPDFDYSELLEAYGATGAVWDEALVAAYLPDPTGFLQAETGGTGRSKMAFQVRRPQDAADISAYLATFPAPEEGDGEAAAD